MALLVNRLTEREPLYRVQEAFTLTDPALLLGHGITAWDLGDDALGRALDKLSPAGAATNVTLVVESSTVTRVIIGSVAATVTLVVDGGTLYVQSISR